jgi:hypothetical protein
MVKSFVKGRLGPVAEPFFRSENALFAGFVPTLLAAVGLWAAWRRYRNPPIPLSSGRRMILGLLLALAAAAWIAGDALTLAGEGKERFSTWTAPAWAGLFLGGAAALAAWAWLRRRWGRGPVLRWAEMDPWTRGLTLSAVASFALAHPIVYVPLMHVLPGLNGMRVPARFAVFVSLAVALFAARGLDLLLERLKTRKARVALVGALALVLVAEMAPRPVRWAVLEREEAFPEVYPWIAAQPDIRALLELPVRPTSAEAIYMYYSTLHWKPIANGYSGYRPASHRALTERMRFLPDDEGLDLLENMWVTHLVVHTNLFKGGLAKLWRWEKRYLGNRVELVHVAGEARVYRLRAGTGR